MKIIGTVAARPNCMKIAPFIRAIDVKGEGLKAMGDREKFA